METTAQARSRRRPAALFGLLGPVLLTLAIFLSPNSPGDNASGAAVIKFYSTHRNGDHFFDILFALAAGVMVIFVVWLFTQLGQARPWLRITGLVGFAITAVGLATAIGFDDVLTSNIKIMTPATAQAINVLDNDFFLPVFVGLFLFGIFTGLAVWRAASMPRGLRWMGIVAIILGVILIFPGINFIGLIGLGLCQAVVGVWLFFHPPVRASVTDNTLDEVLAS